MQAVRWAMRRLRIGLASIGCGLLLVTALILGDQLAAAPTTLDDAAAVALQREGISFRQVLLENVGCIPVPENCQSYSGDILVLGEQPARGRIVCREPAQGCELWITDLDLRGVLVPDPAVAGTGRWIEALSTQIQQIRSRYLR